MWLLILEALLALALLVGIVVWTMSGRRREPSDGGGSEPAGRAQAGTATDVGTPAAAPVKTTEPSDAGGPNRG